MNHRTYLAVILMAAMLQTASAYAGSANFIFRHGARSRHFCVVFSEDAPDAPSALAVGDFNGDGIADIVEATSTDEGPGSLTVLLGRADGTFRPLASRSLTGGDPRALVVGDFNADGNLDVVVGDGDGALTEFIGDGLGGLVASGEIAKLGTVASIAIGHFTRDGKLDIAVADLESNSATIFLGAGDGTFRQTWSFALPQRGKVFHIATADFNQDGIADLVITSENDGNYEVMLGNGNGTFTYAPKLSHLKDPNSYCPT